MSMWIPIFDQFSSFPCNFSWYYTSRNDKSLTACNFLNNGPIFNPQKVLESPWTPLSDGYAYMLFSLKGKWPRCFPFGQISPKCHVTTLNQPIRSNNSLKSPNSRRNLRDIVRLHPKFFPHLKSKAIRTALLKRDQGLNLGRWHNS